MRTLYTAEMNEVTTNAPSIARRGDVAWFNVTDACNAHCVFCAQHVPRATDDLRDRSVLERLDELLADGPPTELLLTGGEPTMHPLLADVIAASREAGTARVVLFTNAMVLADQRRLDTYVAAGLTTVRASLFGDATTSAELTRHPRAWALASRGLDAVSERPLDLQVATVANKATASSLLAMCKAVVTRWPMVSRMVLAPYVARPPGAPHSLHMAPRQLEPVLARAVRLLTDAQIPVFPDAGYGYHLCAFRRPRAVSSLFRRGYPSGASGLVLLPGCAGCALRKRCGGVEETMAAALGEAAIEPVADARRATWAPVHERTVSSDRTNRIAVREATDSAEVLREQVIRVIHACNQRCAFCWVDFEAPQMSLAQVRAAIAENLARATGQAVTITFTGGEPTMHPELEQMVRAARELGADRVHVQTNATRCADPTVAEALADAGVSEALVSLHAPDAAASDKLTAAPGTFERTCAGIRNLCKAGIDVVINHVLTAQLAPRFPEFVTFLHEQLAHPRLVLTVAVAGRIDRGPLDDDVLPTLSSISTPTRQGLALAAKVGLQVRDLVHPCGIPPCVLGADPAIFDRNKMRRVTTRGIAGEAEGCIKPSSCRRCLFDSYCFGVRREYADEHGTDELVPIEVVND